MSSYTHQSTVFRGNVSDWRQPELVVAPRHARRREIDEGPGHYPSIRQLRDRPAARHV